MESILQGTVLIIAEMNKVIPIETHLNVKALVNVINQDRRRL